MTTSTRERQADEVNVLRRASEPAHFLWRGRLYAVRSVRAHWFEEQGLDADPEAGAPDPVDAVGRELWRVEAAAGRTALPAMFDLCLARPAGEWTLAPVAEEEQ